MKDEDENEFTTIDLVFDTPSGAAQYITGRTMAGWRKWKAEDERSLDDYLGNLRMIKDNDDLE